MKPKGSPEEQRAAIDKAKEDKANAEKALEEAKEKAKADAKEAEAAADKKIEADAAKTQADMLKAKRDSVFGPSKAEGEDNSAPPKVVEPKALSKAEVKKDKEDKAE